MKISLLLHYPLVALFSATLAIGSLSLQAVAQDEGTDPAPAEAGDDPADPPADPAGEPAADPEEAAATGPAAKEYEAALAKWKEVIKKLRDTRLQYHEGDNPDKAALQKQWDELIEEGQKLLPEVKTKAFAAYKENPGKDRQLTAFLTKMIEDDLANDEYEEVKKMSEEMIAAGAANAELHDLLGQAAFVLNDYDTAAAEFEKAKDAEALSLQGDRLSGQIEEWKKNWEEEQKVREAEAKADDLPRVKLSTTAGDIVVELFENQAPDTVGNFVSLVEKGFYDGLTFHRVLPGFMAQGGDPRGDGTGGPDYTIYCETGRDDIRRHFRGTLSMAHAGPNTGGSQFFITFRQTPQLDGRHTAFGRVIEGMDTLAEIQRIDPQARNPGIEPTKITKAEVVRKRDHEYKPKKVE